MGLGAGGAVRVLYGTADGLSARGHQVWDEYRLGTRDHGPEDSESEDSPRLGAALVTADFGQGAQDDLVIGVPESLSPGFGSGSIQILYGTASGLASEDARQISQVTPGIQGFDYDEALFGTALAVLRPATSTAYPTLAVAAPVVWRQGRSRPLRDDQPHPWLGRGPDRVRRRDPAGPAVPAASCRRRLRLGDDQLSHPSRLRRFGNAGFGRSPALITDKVSCIRARRAIQTALAAVPRQTLE